MQKHPVHKSVETPRQPTITEESQMKQAKAKKMTNGKN
jgi:hypothetical protein